MVVTQSCLTLCNPMDCSPHDSSVHGILQARILKWVAISFSRGPSWPRDRIWVFCLLHRQASSSPLAPPGKPTVELLKIVVCFLTFQSFFDPSFHPSPLIRLLLWVWFTLWHILRLFIYFHFVQFLKGLEIVLWTLLFLAHCFVFFPNKLELQFPSPLLIELWTIDSNALARERTAQKILRDMKDWY